MKQQPAPTPSSHHPFLDGFDGRIKRVWKSPFYVAALGVVAMFMILLPLVYLAMIAALGYAMYYHATVDWTGLLHSGRVGRVYIYKFIFVYVMPLVVGGVMIVFMIKPLFARPPRREKRLSLVRSNDPLIFEFVDRLCKAVGAPAPKRIDVDWQVNASAGFRRNWISMLLPGDLVLTIGAPLVAGLSINQFAGVLAHEFGHFAQGLGMRLTAIIRAVNHWFLRVVYQRDSWDESLLNLCEHESNWVSLIFLIARLFVWITRRILWVLMVIGQAVSCALLRQMEYDADRHEVRLVGGEVFESTCKRLGELNLASQAIHAEMAETYKDGKLPDNYPLIVANKADDIPEPIRKALAQSASAVRTGLFHTHPSDASRIKHAQKEKAKPVFCAEGLASDLFPQFEGLCKAVTMAYYQELIGPQVTAASLLPTSALVQRRKQALRAKRASERYFCGALSAIRPLRIDPFSRHLDDDGQAAIARIKRARSALARSAPVIGKLYQQYARADDTISAAKAIEALASADVKIDPKVLELRSKSIHQVGEEKTLAQESLKVATEQIAKIEAVLSIRLESGLGLLSNTQITSRVKGWKQLRARAQTLLQTLAAFDRVEHTLTTMRQERLALRAVAHLLIDDPQLWSDQLLRPAERMAARLHGALTDVRNALRDTTYPFAHADGRISIAAYAVSRLPARSDVAGVAVAVERVLDHVETLYMRVMGELAQIAEGVEAALGVKTDESASTSDSNAVEQAPT